MLEHADITEQVIGATYPVYNVLGYGFLEKVYERAMQVELQLRGLKAELEPKMHVHCKGVNVGDYAADLLVEDVVIIELKTTPSYNTADEARLINELKGTGIRVGLLINFGRQKVEFERRVF